MFRKSLHNRVNLIRISVEKKYENAYGFIANPKLTARHNAYNQIGLMPRWFYFSRPTNLAFHDLTRQSTVKPKNLKALLGLGLKFCPIPRFTTHAPVDNLARFERDLFCKIYFSGRPPDQQEPINPRLYVASGWQPPNWDLPPEILARQRNFATKITSLFKKTRRKDQNLLPFQKRTLAELARRHDILILPADKNLGPCVIDTDTYVQHAYDDHLSNAAAYQQLTEEEANNRLIQLRSNAEKWLKKHKKSLTIHERAFIRHGLETSTEHAVFYLTPKIHKSPWSTRPIVSCPSTLLFNLGKWVDNQLQKLASAQPAYFKDTKDLLDHLASLNLPPTARIFSADAVSMYTNIKTSAALREIAQYIHQRSHRWQCIPLEALMQALTLVMRNNIFRFGDTYWLQTSGTAMGTPPAPSYANLFFAIHENRIIRKYPQLACYKRFIDDIIGIWIPTGEQEDDYATWKAFKKDTNSYHGMQWEFVERTNTMNFMDITITLKKGKISTTLFEKLLNVHGYITPHSAHAPGVLTGMVLGNTFRIHSLCSDAADIRRHVRLHYLRLLRRGYQPSDLLALFIRANRLAKERIANPPEIPLEEKPRDDTTIFFHSAYHPNNPSSADLQRVWRDTILQPPLQYSLPRIRNNEDEAITVRRMIVAYRRPRNLGNLLSARNLHLSPGLPVSSHLIRNNEGLREREREREI